MLLRAGKSNIQIGKAAKAHMQCKLMDQMDGPMDECASRPLEYHPPQRCNRGPGQGDHTTQIPQPCACISTALQSIIIICLGVGSIRYYR